MPGSIDVGLLKASLDVGTRSWNIYSSPGEPPDPRCTLSWGNRAGLTRTFEHVVSDDTIQHNVLMRSWGGGWANSGLHPTWISSSMENMVKTSIEKLWNHISIFATLSAWGGVPMRTLVSNLRTIYCTAATCPKKLGTINGGTDI